MHNFINLYREIISYLVKFLLLIFKYQSYLLHTSYLLGGWLFMKIRPAFGDVL
jgi:lipopolysaccharide transport system permease protein